MRESNDKTRTMCLHTIVNPFSLQSKISQYITFSDPIIISKKLLTS